MDALASPTTAGILLQRLFKALDRQGSEPSEGAERASGDRWSDIIQ